MGFYSRYESTGNPRFFEVYGSSARLAFSRHFVVAHVDGFLYVLDKYFCISRLVPARAKSPGPTLQTRGASTTAPVRVANWEANRNAGEDDGRPLTSEQAPPDDCGNQPCVDEDPPEGGQLLLPVRIADVFSTLFRTDRPVFSQLLTGCNQYDQRQLQELRQKSLLLSNRHDGYLYLFLKKFLIRISLRGTVTVVGDLLKLAVAAASRIRANCSPDTTFGGTTASIPPSHFVGHNVLVRRRRGLSPVRQLCSVRQLCREMGHEESFHHGRLGVVTRDCGNSEQAHLTLTGEEHIGSPSSENAIPQLWQYLMSVHERLQLSNASEQSTVDQSADTSSATKRLQEFSACQGENWEVNNCCIDGEGHCFFTVARKKFVSPVEERGMIFCLDTKGPAVRVRALRFGRGITQNAVISLSLAAHPKSGCILMVAKSASEVRNGALNPVTAPMFPSLTSSDLPRDEAVGREASYGWHGSSDRPAIERRKPSNVIGEEGEFMAESSSAGAIPCGIPLSAAETRAAGQSMQDTQQSNGNIPQRSINQIPECRPHQNEVDRSPTDTIENINVDHAQHTVARDNVSTSNWTSSGNFTAAHGQSSTAQDDGQQAVDGAGLQAAPDEHSTWWFCPCDNDPTFFFPVAECIDDEAIHKAAQSICRQFRGNSSSSVCRTCFEDDGETTIRDAKFAATAARTAELTIMATAQAQRQRKCGLGLMQVASAAETEGTRESLDAEEALRAAASQTIKEATLAASRVESAKRSGYILWQPGVKVRRPKTKEEAISFGSAILIRVHITERVKEPRSRLSAGPANRLRPVNAFDSITGELIAVISQDARHVEVRDALPSPLGLIVVPAEAANRIVKQQPDGVSGRIASRNSLSLTSFLASFLSGNPAATSERDDMGGATTPPVQGGMEEFRSLAADGQLNEFPLAGGAAPLSAFALPDNTHQRSIPAVNIVFLVDTLRVCRFVDTYPAHGKNNDDEQGHVRDQRLLGLADAAGVVEEPFLHSLDDIHKSETSVLHQAAVFGDDCVSCAKDGSVSESRNDNLCTCGTASKHHGGCDVGGLHSQFSDVTLLCAGGCEIPSHRALLAARCSFFEAKLTRPHWEAQGPDKAVIDLRAFLGSVVEATVRFFETGYFIIPPSCCCSHCCIEQQRSRVYSYQAPTQRGLPPYESHCCCKVDWVLQAYTFASYCLLQDLKAELLAVLARLISQRTCLYVLTHPAVRNQQQILQLAAHQLVFHMPMPSLLLDVRYCAEADLASTDDASQNAKAESTIRGDAELRLKRRKPMLPLLLIDGIYDAVIKALSAWVLDSKKNIILFSKLHFVQNSDAASPTIRPRQLLVLLALRLLQESIVAPSSSISMGRDPPSSPYGAFKSTFIWESNRSVTESSWLPSWDFQMESNSLLVPLRDSRDAVRHFLFRDIVLLWGKVLHVPEEEAKAVAQGLEDSCLP